MLRRSIEPTSTGLGRYRNGRSEGSGRAGDDDSTSPPEGRSGLPAWRAFFLKGPKRFSDVRSRHTFVLSRLLQVRVLSESVHTQAAVESLFRSEQPHGRTGQHVLSQLRSLGLQQIRPPRRKKPGPWPARAGVDEAAGQREFRGNGEPAWRGRSEERPSSQADAASPAQDKQEMRRRQCNGLSRLEQRG